ncbi:YbfB/YjiJ family MFS transporter [Kribbella sp. VKM Ac-2568]|uniref:YbfB/YjiJ family MFS transporter n=1 Tax=Kribbella sp. VKM Ac-2568 TaxID=2512219 RepID=UPI0010EB297D|nr:YbfB/YjiJ family MFS transporter [Kribbella sp. VKM Ac-2568]TCM46917.1 putative MFS-type transporter YbfB [Kribbella sp. VKM Ac-2568]
MTAVPSAHPWRTAGHGAAALAAGMGVGRFAYTPILPLMHAQAGLPARLGATLATANYVGYLVGAAAAIGVLRHRFPHHLGPLPSRVQGNYHHRMEEEHDY